MGGGYSQCRPLCRASPSSRFWVGAIFSLSSPHFFLGLRAVLMSRFTVSLFLALTAGVQLQAEAPSAEQMSKGQQVYMQVCFACHQPTGLGLPNMFPSLASSDWVAAPKPDRLIRMVLHGLTGPIKVNGQPFNTPAPLMPAQGLTLNDEQIAAVLTYVRNSFGNQAPAVAADQVKAIREAEKARTAMWTEAELEKIPVK